MGPLKGYKIIELAGLGPTPFAGMMLADMGAEVVLVERSKSDHKVADCNRRGKRSIALNLKTEEGRDTLLQLVKQADALIEGFRPGVLERLGIGPKVLHEVHPKLIIGRMTGWGQTGPLSHAAGHDINYISLTGALRATGRKGQKPTPPLNLVGDYGGGAMMLVNGVLAALLERTKSQKGQVIDVAMTDGSALLMSIFHSLDGMGQWSPEHGSNLLDSGAFFYDVYETKDGKYISIGSLEPQFYLELITKLELDSKEYRNQYTPSLWPELSKKLEQVFLTKTRDVWCELLEGSDVCFAPVLDYKEAPQHPHNVARKTYMELDGITQPAPAPRFSRTPSEVSSGSPMAGEHTGEVLRDWGV